MSQKPSSFVPYRDIRGILNGVERPGRYLGGEFGLRTPGGEPEGYRVCVAFPDLYEIAMSNQAVRILYHRFNDVEGVSAERVFAPAPDFERALAAGDRPLFSLETGTPLSSFDMIALSVGYELGITNFLTILASGGIPQRRRDRGGEDPLVVAGGPAMTNPEPWGAFVDAVFIGEAEGFISDLMPDLASMKRSGASRSDILGRLAGETGVWLPEETGKVRRRSWEGFGREGTKPPALPIPSIQVVQDNGVIEIMRGCPNKCRFCHAGVFYRPYRQKNLRRIFDEAAYLVNDCGYRSITLSSLSTGDYSALEPLVDRLNTLYASKHVSFNLPSLRVDSVTLPLIGKLNAVRKSGLTFAVETPTLTGQKGINKVVPEERIVSILREAKAQGWRSAKFYFMIGLPVNTGDDEVNSIVDYLHRIGGETRIQLHVNVGTFIPKPHTPFERSAQLTDHAAMERILGLRNALKPLKNIRFSFHAPYSSFIEGLIARGDARAGEIVWSAWNRGARLDSWDDHMNREIWKSVVQEADWAVEDEVCRPKTSDEPLPWNRIDMGVTRAHLKKEAVRGSEAALTEPCRLPCDDHCGGCTKTCQIRTPDDVDALENAANDDTGVAATPTGNDRVLLIYRKTDAAAYWGHLDVMSVFERAFQRAGVPLAFTEGFNPKPRLEFAQPLPLGVESQEEVLIAMTTYDGFDAEILRKGLAIQLPPGLIPREVHAIPPVSEGRKKKKAMGLYWGSDWRLVPDNGQPLAPDFSSTVERVARSRGIIDDLTILDGGGGFTFRLRHGGRKEHNLMRFLEEILGENPLAMGWGITRLRTWASGAGGEPVPYVSALSAEVFDSSQ